MRVRRLFAMAGLVLLSVAAVAAAQEERRPRVPPGLMKAFIPSDSDRDQYGNPVVRRDRSTFEPTTGWPYEVWLREPRMEFVLVQPGEFVMGVDRSKLSRPAHRVRITKPFYLGTYEEYVKEHVLAPLGIRAMQIGQTAQEDLAPNEVHYGRERQVTAGFGPHKGKRVVVAYARCIPVMDANGGWIASVVDLMRFAAAFDDPAQCPILSEESVKGMFARPEGVNGFDADGNPRASYYALGWSVKPNGLGQLTTSHGGGMEGTSTALVRQHDGINWVVLFSCYGSPHARGALRGMIGESLCLAIDSMRDWPDHDLFSKLE